MSFVNCFMLDSVKAFRAIITRSGMKTITQLGVYRSLAQRSNSVSWCNGTHDLRACVWF